MSLCARCGKRWSQSMAGFCRRCERDLGVDERTSVQREADRQARLLAMGPQPFEPTFPPWRTLEAEGLVFWVIWDGNRYESPVQACRRFGEEGVT